MASRIKSAAIKKNGTVRAKPRPAHHKDIGTKGGKRGFLTNDNKFVGRTRAAKIATKAGQVKKCSRPVSRLHSGDMW